MSLLRAYHTGHLTPFIFSDDIEGTPSAFTSWAYGPESLLFEVAYFGPLVPDPLTRNGLICLSPLSHLSQVVDR